MTYQVRDELKDVITRKGLTVADVGRRAGVSYSHLSAIVNGRVDPSPRIACAIAEALSASPTELFPDVVAA